MMFVSTEYNSNISKIPLKLWSMRITLKVQLTNRLNNKY